MIYAATRATLTKDLGDSHFTDSIYGTNKSDFTLDGYKKHRASLNAPKPLTERERQLAEIKENEKIMVESMKGGAYRKSHAPGMSFPLTEKAIAALKKLAPVTPAAKPSATVAATRKVTSPASTPLPESPVITRENTSSSTTEVKKASETAEVADDEWEEDKWDEEKTREVKRRGEVEDYDTTTTTTTKVKTEEPKPTLEETKTTAEEPKTAATTVSAAAEAEPTQEEKVSETKEEEAPAAPVKAERTINFVTLAIDAENERIDLAGEAKIGANELVRNIHEESPRFTFFAYEHKHNGVAHDSLVFMYTCPTKSKIRERMLYSSCRAGVLQAAKDDADLNVDKKLETTDVSDLTETFVLEELHPRTSSPAFGGNNAGVGARAGTGAVNLGLGSGGARGFSKPARPGARKVM
ncbi:Twinfilin-1 [Lobosporangium transversale]|nr:Twinfilin-1 [Lobosporangium transversale]